MTIKWFSWHISNTSNFKFFKHFTMADSFAVMSDNADEYAPVNIQDVVMDTQLDVTIEEYADV